MTSIARPVSPASAPASTPTLYRTARAGRVTLYVVILLALLGTFAYFMLTLGTPQLGLNDLGIIFGGGGDRLPRIVVTQLREPRLVIGITAGAMLALAGTLLQDALRNPLSGPELLGVSAGSSATVAVITIFNLPVLNAAIPLFTLAGGVTAGAIVILTMSKVGDPIRLILMGISVNALLYALIVTVTSLGDQSSVGLLYLYLLGSIANRTWDYVNIILPWAVIAIPAALLMARPLNLLQLGDEVAEGMGLRVTRIRLLIALIAAALVAGVVAVCGPIAFVALVAPHITRRALNTTDARVILPLSALTGATLLLGADVLAKNLFDPMELPVGIWTTVLGGPLLLLMLRRQLGADSRQGGSRG